MAERLRVCGLPRYFHRTLNPVKLVDIGFTPVRRGDTVSRMARRFALPSETSTPGFREMRQDDIPQVLDLMKRYMAKFDLEQKFDTEAEIEHWFVSGRGTGEYQKGRGRDGQVAWAYVVEVSGVSEAESTRTRGSLRAKVSTYALACAGPGNTSLDRLHVLLLASLAHHEACQAQGSRNGLPLLLRY
jgi:hypothetical protein